MDDKELSKDFKIYYGKDICHICQKPSYIKIRYKTRDSRHRNTIHYVSLCNDCASMIENEWREKFHKESGNGRVERTESKRREKE